MTADAMRSLARRAAGRGVAALCGVVGRRQVVRAARFVLYRSRLDVPNDPGANGEYALQRWVLAALPPTTPLTVMDVGANVGAWSANLLAAAGSSGHRLDLHAFEPSRHTHQLLVANLPATAQVNRLAVTDRVGEVALHTIGPSAGRNSLLPQRTASAEVEPVGATTIDDYMAQHDIAYVDLLKIDAEGHDCRVLHGAGRSFERRAVSVAQFEYNHRWVHGRCFLKDIFDLLSPLGYRIGKLTPRGVEWYPAWDPDLETFVEGNYLACTPELARRLPSVRWWKGDTPSCT
ncbi:FkbM family methyltransferase [Phytoactinopolyspora halotolerans]|uniref:FkbM family methyltransferase n=1 Tax=Phytoactinopolyspora halotolerans TaxID=1981512 RepID=A0A6L9S5B7_9ACTN|nr:FkbM family methyltransferase [Phytoactinopolyspora halotolerans]NEE00183.1 FkbM family methyltransferase [Phytoactinopolyspora halotolerans]